MVMKAVGKGYRMLPWRNWRGHNKLVARYRLNVDTIPVGDQCDALEQMANELGKEFDKFSNFRPDTLLEAVKNRPDLFVLQPNDG